MATPADFADSPIRCLITDGAATRDRSAWLGHLSAWIHAGIELVQIREPELTPRQLAETVRAVLRLPRPRGSKILVNDRADVAIACGADGVHLKDGSVSPEVFARLGLLVSVAVHDPAEADKAEGADFIIVAPIFAPLSKKKARPALGTGAITELRRVSSIPILALGGITEANAHLCLEAGAAGIAGISCFSGLPGGCARASLLP